MLKNILKYILIGLSALLVILLMFGIVLVLDWPWWVGFFILIGLVGLGIAAYLLQQVWRKKREQLFVSEITEQDEAYRKSLQESERKNLDEVQARFTEAVAALKRSHLKKLGNPLYVLPWYMVIGESGSGKSTAIKSAKLESPFAEMTQVSGLAGTKNCDWWFFEQAIIIDTAGRYAIPVDEGRDKDEWQKFLGLLVRFRKKEPLNGLVVTVAADRLLEGGTDALAEDGRQIRRRIDELMRVLGSKFPVYVLVTKCDLIQGMTQFCDQLDEELLKQAFGAINHDNTQDYPAFLARVMHTLRERLASFRLLIFHKPAAKIPDPALLLFPEEFGRLQSGLAAFMQSAFQVNPYQETPMLRGLFFSSGRQEGSPYSHFLKALGLIEDRQVLPGTSRGLFLHDFFARILPKERGLFAPTKQAMAWNKLTLNLGLLAWVAIGIALCGLLSFSFVKNMGIIRGIPAEFARPIELKNDLSADLTTMERYRQAILKVEQKNGSWWIPRLGLTESRGVESTLKQNYSRLFDTRFLAFSDKQLALEIRNLAPADPRMGEYIVHLIYRLNLLKARLGDEDLEKALAQPRATLALAGQDRQDATLFTDLYAYRLRWDEDRPGLEKEAAQLERLLSEALAKGGDLTWIPTWINANPALAPVTLNAFWGGSQALGEDIRIAPAYTLAGKQQIDRLLTDLEATLSNPGTFAARKAEFLTGYRDAYLDAWHGFGLNFNKGIATLKGREEWRNVALRAAAKNGPHFQLMQRLCSELKPFQEIQPEPDWMRLVYEFEQTQLLAMGVDTGAVAKASETASKLKEKIQEKIGKEQSETVQGLRFDAARAYKDYQAALAKVAAGITQSRAAAFQTATVAFGDDPTPSPFMAAQNAYRRLNAASALPSEAFWTLIYGPLDLLWAYTCQESACQLQALWEKEVVADTQGITDPAQLNQLLFAPEGLATKFIKGPAAPFVGRDLKRGYYPKEALGRSLPFENAFLVFFSRAKVGIPMAALAQAASDNAVTVSGLPTEANDSARLQPQLTRLDVQCLGGMQSLANMNFPVSKVFTWSPQCSGVVFTIEVGNVVLTRMYTGPEAFAKFLMDFPGGRHTFTPADFPQQAGALRALGITYIKAQYRFSGHQAIINQAKPSLSQPTQLPVTIVRCTAG
ncbi:MAG: type VI secretion protein IcmF/TssM N-terminal domain-containing protein [Syntrophaceae bacterium]